MALLTITVRRDVVSGRTTVRVGLSSDADAMPHEHEAMHDRLVAALAPGAAVERERPAKEAVVG
jgi:hypothetical protein